MLDFTEGWVWFVTGLAATLVASLAALCVVLAARIAEGRRRARPTRP